MGGSKPTIGYRYYLGVHAAICTGPVDEVRALYFDEKEAWRGSINNNATILVNKPGLFGGEKKEGGVVGNVDVMMGGASQGVNEYLASQLGGNVPAFRGLLSLVFRGASISEVISSGGLVLRTSALASQQLSFMWSAMNPYIKPVSVEVKRILSSWNGGVWYPEKAAIGDDMNPAHIIYQCITDPQWGAGLPSSLIDDTAARAAADILFTEGFGMSLQWSQQTSVESFIAEILRHVDGSLYLDQATGKFVLSLNRFNYNPATLPIYNEDQIKEVEEYKRAAWGETTNEIVLTYTDAATEEPATVSVQNLSNIRIQGGIVSASRNYSGIRNANLAYRVAERDLRVVSTPLAMMTFTINRSAWQTNPGDVFRINWPDLGLSDVVFRAVEVDYGSLSNGTIRVQAVEDVFALPSNTYGGGQDSGWADPGGVPSNITTTRVVEANYVDALIALGEVEVEDLSPTETFPFVMAEKPSAINNEAAVYVSPDTVIDNYIQTDEGLYTPTVLVPASYDRSTTSVVYSTSNGFSWNGALGATAYWDDEIILVESVDSSTQTLTIKRAVLDSIPQQHAAGSKIWFHDQQMGVFVGMAGLVSGETAYLRTVGVSTSQQSALASAPVDVFVGSARWNKPWPPANVKINGDYYPSVIRGNFTITWAGRNRLQQNVDFVGWYEDHIVPESGTTYTLEVYDANTNALIRSVTGLTTTTGGGSYTYPGFNSTNATAFRIRLFAVRSGVSSHVVWEHTADLVGYGLNYDYTYGGFTAGIVLPPSATNVIPETQYTPIPEPVWVNGAWRDLNTGIFWASYDNGASWSIEAQGPFNPYFDDGYIIYGNDYYIQFGGSGSYIKYRKTGGLWKEANLSSPPGSYSSGGSIASVTFDGGRFVMLKNGGKDVYTCVDPSTETWVHVGTNGVVNQLASRCYALFIDKVGSQYVALGSKDSKMWATTSTDLISWTAEVEVPFDLGYFRQQGAFFNGYYFMPRQGNDPNVPLSLLRSPDLINWTAVDVGASQGMYYGYLIVMSNAMYILSPGFVIKTTNGTSFTVHQSFLNYGMTATYLRAKRTRWTQEAGPNRAILYHPYPKEQGGKLVYVTALEADWSSAQLLYPPDAVNGKNIGVLGRAAIGSTEDSGFLVSDTTQFTPTGLIARNTDKRYFEIKLISKNTTFGPSLDAPLIFRLGASIFSRAGNGNPSYIAVNSNGFFLGANGDAASPPLFSYQFQVGQVFGIEIDFPAAVANLYIDNVLFGSIPNIDVSQRWVPLVGALFCTLELNLGQKTFVYSRPGIVPWLS